MDGCLANQRDLEFMRRAFWSQIRSMFGSLDTARLSAAKGVGLSKQPEEKWVSEMNGDQIPL